MVEGNDEDLEVTTIHTTKEQNIKRIKRGQVAFPTKVFIRPKKEFKQYVRDFDLADVEYNKSKLSYCYIQFPTIIEKNINSRLGEGIIKEA